VNVRRRDDLPSRFVIVRTALAIKPLGLPPTGRLARIRLGGVGRVGSNVTIGAAPKNRVRPFSLGKWFQDRNRC
jgi:hypothetical protein